MYIRTHSVVGVSVSLLILNPSVESLYSSLIFSTLGSILPDIDHEYVASKRIFPLLIFISLLCLYLDLLHFNNKSIVGITLFISILIIYYLGEHRTISHSLLGLILISIPVYIINPIAISPFILGYGFHLIADSFTKTGIKLFYPYKNTSYGLKIINMYKIGDFPFFIFSLLIFLLIIIHKHNIFNTFLSFLIN